MDVVFIVKCYMIINFFKLQIKIDVVMKCIILKMCVIKKIIKKIMYEKVGNGFIILNR